MSLTMIEKPEIQEKEASFTSLIDGASSLAVAQPLDAFDRPADDFLCKAVGEECLRGKRRDLTGRKQPPSLAATLRSDFCNRVVFSVCKLSLQMIVFSLPMDVAGPAGIIPDESQCIDLRIQ